MYQTEEFMFQILAYRPTVYKTGTVTLRLSQPFNSAWYLPSRLSKLKIQWHFLITAGPVRYSFTRLASSNFWREQQTATVEFYKLWSFQLRKSTTVWAIHLDIFFKEHTLRRQPICNLSLLYDLPTDFELTLVPNRQEVNFSVLILWFLILHFVFL